MKLSRVNERLYRSDQPSLGDLEDLRAMGIETIINLRREDARLWRAEGERARELGMRFFHFPFYGVFGARTKFLDAILREMTRPENGVVLVHCLNGQDRTSLLIGLHNVIHGGSSADQSWAADFVAHGHDPDRPPPRWRSGVRHFFYRNFRRTFHRHLAARAHRD
ncbi:MAG: sulfur transferase domain-containing protein [Minicystis sp.]